MEAKTSHAGHVKWFNTPKGYGFLRVPGEDADVLFHHSHIVGGGFRRSASGITYIDEGERVFCEYARRDRGLVATKVWR